MLVHTYQLAAVKNCQLWAVPALLPYLRHIELFCWGYKLKYCLMVLCIPYHQIWSSSNYCQVCTSRKLYQSGSRSWAIWFWWVFGWQWNIKCTWGPVDQSWTEDLLLPIMQSPVNWICKCSGSRQFVRLRQKLTLPVAAQCTCKHYSRLCQAHFGHFDELFTLGLLHVDTLLLHFEPPCCHWGQQLCSSGGLVLLWWAAKLTDKPGPGMLFVCAWNMNSLICAVLLCATSWGLCTLLFWDNCAGVSKCIAS